MSETKTKTATFGAGCFWGVEAKFAKQQGVTQTAVGYMGGLKDQPTYEDVCTDRTGHAEVVQLEYDPSVVSFQALLSLFFDIHDPTTLNRQGPDIGSQYRSVVFFHSEEQRELAEEAIAALEKAGRFKNPVVTKISPASEFWRAEEYHQKYLLKRGMDECHL